MSMYSQLLQSAFGQRSPVMVRSTERSALDAVRRCRGELEEDRPRPTDSDAVPIALFREIGYDVALLELAGVVGIETDPSRFEQPLHERARLERALRARGIMLHPQSVSGGTTAPPP
jgi:hypothetical protein